MKYILFLVLMILYSCSEDNSVNSKSDLLKLPFPDSVLIKSNNYLISQVGEDFFDSYISFDRTYYQEPTSYCIENPDSCPSYRRYPYYLMIYNFIIPEKSYVNEEIQFFIDTTGNFIPEYPPYGIPVCPDNSCIDNFPLIDENQARQIASDAGLEQGIREWKIDFYFYAGDIDDYVWSIANTLYENDSESGLQSGGKSVIINSHNGDVLWILNWGVTP